GRVGGAVVQLKVAAVELVHVEGHVVDRGLGDDLLEGRVLPGALGLGVATLVTELGELVTLGVSNGLPTGQGVARLPGRQLRRGRRSRTHRATENVTAGRCENGVVVFCHLFSLVPRGPNSEMNEALNA